MTIHKYFDFFPRISPASITLGFWPCSKNVLLINNNNNNNNNLEIENENLKLSYHKGHIFI